MIPSFKVRLSFRNMFWRGLISCLALSLPAMASPLYSQETGRDSRLPLIAAIDDIVQLGIQNGNMPGAVVLVGQRDKILHRAAYGNRQIEPAVEAMTLDTLFDVASLTKPVATGISVMLLAEQKKIEIQAPVARYLPEFAANGKDQVTIEQLLTHTSGLIADNAMRDYSEGKEAAWKKICQLKLQAAPGEKFVYSDVGFIVLGVLVERLAGASLDEFSQQQIFTPLALRSTRFCPPEEEFQRCAPAEKRNGEWIRGVVHDPRSHAMDGIAGHAGLFSTADDLAIFAQMIINHGRGASQQILKPETVEQILVSRAVPPNGLRTLGWDRKTGYSSNRGTGMGARSIGHGGFTGTGLWIDPDSGLYVVFLSNRLHPNGKGAVNSLIGKIGTVAVESIQPTKTPRE